MVEFRKKLEELINKNSMENASNTPDFILAEYLIGCLSLFDTAIQQRETWKDMPPEFDKLISENFWDLV